MKTARAIIDSSGNDVFCQLYCIYLMMDKDKKRYETFIKNASKIGVEFDEFVMTEDKGSTRWYYYVVVFLENYIKVCQSMNASYSKKGEVLNLIKCLV